MLPDLFFVGRENSFMENLLVSIRCITPVLLTMCLGIWLRSRRLAPDEMYGHLSTLCFHGLLPFQMFYNIYAAQLEGAFSLKLLIYLEGGLLAWFALSYALFSAAEPDRRTRGAYIQNAFRSNIAVVGVSLAQTMMGSGGVAAMSIATAVLVPTYNVLAVITLESCRGGQADLRQTVRMILKNPLIIACALGVLCLLLGVRFPQPVDQAVKNLGNAGSVVTLVALGASLRLEGARGNRKKIVFCSLYRLVLTPLVMIVVAVLLGFRGDHLGVIMLCAGTPMATTSYPMALACDSDHELTAQVVVTTSLLFCLTMFLWIFALKQLELL